MLSIPRQVLDGIWQITLPLPFELNHVNTYLVRLRDGWMLIDCGLNTDESFAQLTAQLDYIGVPVSGITEIFLTHTHPDHVGQARRLLEVSGAKLSLHLDELDQLLRVARSGDKPLWLDSILHRAGVPEDLVVKIEGSFDRIRRNFHELQPARVLNGSETIESAVGPLELILTPGHSPGHLCLYSREHRTLIAGDHILQRITPNIGWLPERDALGDFICSLDRVDPFEIDLILPGHGAPFRGHREWIRETKSHHDDRCCQILSSLQGQARTAHQLVSDLWTRPLAPFHHRFAVFEVLAHLEYLLRREKVRCEQGDVRQFWVV
jgi:glyoxylase-like metal-dependent hydrolase (beta-lactamase superfamily II)